MLCCSESFLSSSDSLSMSQIVSGISESIMFFVVFRPGLHAALLLISIKGDIYISLLLYILSVVNLSRLRTGIVGLSALAAMNMSKLCNDAWVVCFSLK